MDKQDATLSIWEHEKLRKSEMIAGSGMPVWKRPKKTTEMWIKDIAFIIGVIAFISGITYWAITDPEGLIYALDLLLGVEGRR